MHRLPVSERMLLWQKVGVPEGRMFQDVLVGGKKGRSKRRCDAIERCVGPGSVFGSTDRQSQKGVSVGRAKFAGERGRYGDTWLLLWGGDAAPHIFLFLRTETRRCGHTE